MVDFKKLGSRRVVTPRAVLTMQIELNDSMKTIEEIEQRLHMMIEGHQSNGFSHWIVDLIRETSSSTWELINFDVKE